MLKFRGAVNQIILRLNKTLIDNAVHSCVVYPKATALTKQSVHEITVEEFSADKIKVKLNENQSMLMSIYARGAMTDVEDCSHVIEVIKGKAPVSGLRFIQIRKTGIDILRINLMGGEQNERAAFIEMNEYKRQFIENAKNRNSNILLIMAICSILYAGYELHSITDKILSKIEEDKPDK